MAIPPVSTAKGFYPPAEMKSNNPEWKHLTLMNIPGANVIKSSIKSAHKSIEKIQLILDKISQALTTVQDIVKLIQKFETILNKGLYLFLDLILDKFEELYNDIKSTGIYALDLTSYHFINYQEVDGNDDYYKAVLKGDAWYHIPNKAEYDNNNIANSFFYKIGKKAEGIIYRTREDNKNLRGGYLLESYNQFIDRICRAFSDNNDLPDRTVAMDDKTVKAFNTLYLDPKKSLPQIFNGWTDWDKISKKNFDSGRPNFGQFGNLKVYLFVVATPDIDPFINFIIQMQKIFSNIKVGDFAPKGFQGLKNWLKDTDYNVPQIDYSYVPSSDEPNFVGITLNNIPGFNRLFNVIDQLILTIRSFRTKTNITGILDQINVFIESTLDEINRLNVLIAQIDDMLSLLDMFISLTGIYYLQITTDQGNAGVIDALKNATGFFARRAKDVQEFQDKEAVLALQKISEIEEAKTNAANIKLKKEKAELLLSYSDTLTTNTNTWNIYKETMAQNTIGTLSLLISELDSILGDYNIDLSDLQLQILNLNNDENSLSSLSVLLEDTIVEKNNFLDSMNETIDADTAELNAIIAQQADPNQPNVENYDAKVEELTNSIATSEETRDSEEEVYEELIDRYNNIYNYIDVLDKEDYAYEITSQQDALAILKAAYNDIEDTYIDTKTDKEDDIILKQGQLETAEGDREDVYEDYLDKLTEIQSWQFANPGGTVPSYLINERDALKSDLDDLDETIQELTDDIATLENDLILLKQARDNDLLINAKQQTGVGLTINVLLVEQDIYELELEVADLISEHGQEAGIIQTKINNIFANGYNTILSLQLPTISLFNAGKIFISNPVIATYSLAKNENYNVRDPDVTRLNNAKAVVNNELSALVLNLEAADDLVKQLEAEETKRLKEVAQELALYTSSDKIFDPDKKMYFAGGLMCYGWPGKDDDGNYFSFNKYAKDAYNNARMEIGENKLDVKNEINFIDKLFK